MPERAVIDVLIFVAILCVCVPLGYRMYLKSKHEVEDLNQEEANRRVNQVK